MVANERQIGKRKLILKAFGGLKRGTFHECEQRVIEYVNGKSNEGMM